MCLVVSISGGDLKKRLGITAKCVLPRNKLKLSLDSIAFTTLSQLTFDDDFPSLAV
jgi:hypothetical protein